MENSEKMAIASLLDRDPELKQYYEEHQELEKKLDEFQRAGLSWMVHEL